jgi:cation diffusion facilitator family transporter
VGAERFLADDAPSHMHQYSSSKSVIYAALVGDALVTASKFIAAAWTGSAGMLAEAVHSLVDMTTEGLLLYGFRRSRQPPNTSRPFGYGRELYFWSFMVSLMFFTLAAGVAVLEGAERVLNPQPIENAKVSYLVIALSFVFEGASLWIAVRHVGHKGIREYIAAFRSTKDPTAFVVLFEGSAALLGLGVALVGTWAATQWKMPVFDAGASIVIGLILGATAILLTIETKSLLIGEPARSSIANSIKCLAGQEDGIRKINGLLTTHLAPDQIVAALSVEFDDDLTTPELETKVAAMEKRVRAKHPEVISLFVKPQTPAQFMAARKRRGFESG